MIAPEPFPAAPPPPPLSPSPEQTSNVTVATTVCALLGGLTSVPVSAFTGPQPPPPFAVAVPPEPPLALVIGGFVVQALGVLFLLLGAFLLLGRKNTGRHLVVVGAALVIVATVLPMFQPGPFFTGVTSLFGLGLPVAAGVLALLPATRAHVDRGEPSTTAVQPSMATGVLAGVLALVAALMAATLPMALLGGLMISSSHPGSGRPYRWSALEWFALAHGVNALLLFAGAILLFARLGVGRNLTVAGGLLTVAVAVAQIFVTPLNGGNALGFVLVSMIGPVIAGAAAILALAPRTSDWIAARSATTRKKSFRAMAIAAGVFAWVGTVPAAYMSLMSLLAWSHGRGPQVGPPPAEPARAMGLLGPLGLLFFVSAVLLFIGGIALFAGLDLGRTLTVVGAAVSVVAFLLPVVVGMGREGEAVRVLPMMIVSALPAAVGGVLALASGRVAARRE